MTRKTIFAMFAVWLACDAAPVLAQQVVQFQPPPGPRLTQRGRIRIRNTPYRSIYRERWGNGLTPQGAAVLNNFIAMAGQVLPMVLPTAGGPVPSGGEAGERAEPDYLSKETHDQRMAELRDLNSQACELLKCLGLSDDEVNELCTQPAVNEPPVAGAQAGAGNAGAGFDSVPNRSNG